MEKGDWRLEVVVIAGNDTLGKQSLEEIVRDSLEEQRL